MQLKVKDLRKAAFVLLVAPLQILVGVHALPAETPPACAQVIAAAMSSESAVTGSFDCLGGRLAMQAAMYGIETDEDFSNAIKKQGSMTYIGRAPSGGYLYDAGGAVFDLTVEDGKVVSVQ